MHFPKMFKDFSLIDFGAELERIPFNLLIGEQNVHW